MLTTAATFLKGGLDLVLNFVKSLANVSVVWLFLVALAGYYTFKAGNQYGSYARAYRAVAAELTQKNKELDAARTDDERDIQILNAARDAATAKAAGIKTCPATKDTAKRLNAIGE